MERDNVLTMRARPREPQPEPSIAERRQRCLELALNRGGRGETIGETIVRAEQIRRYVEEGEVPISPAPCSA